MGVPYHVRRILGKQKADRLPGKPRPGFPQPGIGQTARHARISSSSFQKGPLYYVGL
jgi:hypothetical protein